MTGISRIAVVAGLGFNCCAYAQGFTGLACYVTSDFMSIWRPVTKFKLLNLCDQLLNLCDL
ncbi:hypothetical protein BpHYR1_007667, partial [Brachionus plicatilis]